MSFKKKIYKDDTLVVEQKNYLNEISSQDQ